MTFLPIVARELRVASRRRATYWVRTISAFAVILLGTFFFPMTLNRGVGFPASIHHDVSSEPLIRPSQNLAHPGHSTVFSYKSGRFQKDRASGFENRCPIPPLGAESTKTSASPPLT